MKILHVIFSLNIGGSETMLVDILNEQATTGNPISLIIINKEYNESLLNKIDKKVNIYFCNRKKGSHNILPVLRLNYLILRINPDIIHAHDHTFIQVLIQKKWKTILTLHAIGFETKNFSKYTHVCAISKAVQQDITDRSNIRAELIYNGINIETIKKKKEMKSSDTFRIIQVGRLEHDIKGQDILIDALSIINKNENPPAITIDLVGEGKSYNYLQNLIKGSGLESQVNLPGVKSRQYIYSHLCEYDLLVQPSRTEGFGLTIAEAMAAGIPVLVSDNDGPMEIIENGKFGFYFEKGNPEDCADKILEIMNNKNLEEITERAYKHTFNNFNIKNTAKQYVDLYKKTLSSTNY